MTNEGPHGGNTETPLCECVCMWWWEHHLGVTENVTLELTEWSEPDWRQAGKQELRSAPKNRPVTESGVCRGVAGGLGWRGWKTRWLIYESVCVRCLCHCWVTVIDGPDWELLGSLASKKKCNLQPAARVSQRDNQCNRRCQERRLTYKPERRIWYDWLK